MQSTIATLRPSNFEIIIAEMDAYGARLSDGHDARAVACETCNRLLVDYKCSVHLFSDEVSRSLGALGSDSRLDTRRLKQACQDALDAIIEHRRLEHNGHFPPKSRPSSALGPPLALSRPGILLSVNSGRRMPPVRG